jgi:hypothetical protein
MKYVTPPTPPYPAVKLRITDNGWDTPLQYDPFDAMLDTGASITGVPENKVPVKARNLIRVRQIRLADGTLIDREFVLLRKGYLEVLDEKNQPVVSFTRNAMYLLIIPVGLLGRDLLNDCICSLNGPAQTFSLTKP